MTANTFERFDPGTDKAAFNGRPVTEADIDLLAEKAEASGPPAGLLPGGKSLSSDGTKSPRVQVVLSRETEARVRELAARDHMSVSRWIRCLVERETA